MSIVFGQLDMANPECQSVGMPETPMTDDQLREIVEWYDKATEDLLDQRDAKLRAARASGRIQADIGAIPGYSRELGRQALDPKIREAVRAARAARKAGA